MRRATLLVQVGVLARRSVVRTLRQPAMVVPSLVFPLMLLSINSSGLDSATNLPGFPTDSYFQFALAIAFVQGALFSANSAGTNVASDIESGFLNRLAQSAHHRAAREHADLDEQGGTPHAATTSPASGSSACSSSAAPSSERPVFSRKTSSSVGACN